MRMLALALLFATAGCGDDRPPGPTAEESARLNAAEAMLNAAGNEEGPEAPASDPSTNAD